MASPFYKIFHDRANPIRKGCMPNSPALMSLEIKPTTLVLRASETRFRRKCENFCLIAGEWNLTGQDALVW